MKKVILMIITSAVIVTCCALIAPPSSYYAILGLPQDKTLENLMLKFGQPTISKSSGEYIVSTFDGFTTYHTPQGAFVRVEIWSPKYEFKTSFSNVHIGSSETDVDNLVRFRHQIKNLPENRKGFIIGKDWVAGEWVTFSLSDKKVDKIIITTGP